jgi:lysyl-tRNA synthetase class 2
MAANHEESRRTKLANIRDLGFDPFQLPDGFKFTPIERVRRDYDPAHGKDGGPYHFVSGRILLRRGMGKLGFLTIVNDGQIQIALDHSRLSESQKIVAKNLDLGDIVIIGGTLGATQTGEITIWADYLYVASKCLLPPPDKQDGLKDPETRYRNRQVDLWTKEVADVMRIRSKVLYGLRSYLGVVKSYMEVETPILQPSAGGATAKPFSTHHNALDTELFLRIAPELYLKRLIIGGFNKVFEIGKNFRNEGVDATHNPEFTSLEAYEAFGTRETMMELTENLLHHAFWTIASSVTGEFQHEDKVINIKPPFQRMRLVDVAPGSTPEEKYAYFEEKIQPTIVQPTFVLDLPSSNFPLARRFGNGYSSVFELIINGLEIGAGYTEQNDPDEQLAAFKEQSKDGHVMDEDFVNALKSGMPPTGGIGIGVDRLVALFANQHNIRDVILFPVLRPS